MSSCHAHVPWRTCTSHPSGVKNVINHGLTKGRWFRLNLLNTLPYLPCLFVCWFIISSYLCLGRVDRNPRHSSLTPCFGRPKIKRRSWGDLGQCWIWQTDRFPQDNPDSINGFISKKIWHVNKNTLAYIYDILFWVWASMPNHKAVGCNDGSIQQTCPSRVPVKQDDVQVFWKSGRLSGVDSKEQETNTLDLDHWQDSHDSMEQHTPLHTRWKDLCWTYVQRCSRNFAAIETNVLWHHQI